MNDPFRRGCIQRGQREPASKYGGDGEQRPDLPGHDQERRAIHER
jgi:hypothetical protein